MVLDNVFMKMVDEKIELRFNRSSYQAGQKKPGT